MCSDIGMKLDLVRIKMEIWKKAFKGVRLDEV